tara:strand:- start:1917 stop:3365 length:1449 start_codon:yes stop_codon:yes gene_type:complete
MKFEGNNIRKLTGQKNISFLLNNASISNLTGEVSFGFSGESKSIEFKFSKGKIYDANGYYVHSYDDSSRFSISGDISESYYDYTVDSVSIARGAAKENFKIENFFVNANNCNLDCELFIYSDGIPYAFTLPSSVDLGESFTAQITNNSTDGTLEIFSALLQGTTKDKYSVSSFPTTILPQETKDFTFKNEAGIQGNHEFNLDLKTNIGTLSIEKQIQAKKADVITVLNSLSLLGAGSLDDYDFSSTNSENSTIFIYNSSIIGSNLLQEVSPTLEYVEGNIGKYYKVKEVIVYNSGQGYIGAPTVTFSDGQGNDIQAQGNAVMGGEIGESLHVESVNIVNSGVYFNQPPVVTFGGFLDPNDTGAYHASAQVITEEYEKTFSNSWDIYVGYSLSGSVISYNDSNYTGNQGENTYPYGVYGPGIYEDTTKYSISNSQGLYLTIKGKSFDDYDQMKVKLKMTATMADSTTNSLTEEIEILGGNTVE